MLLKLRYFLILATLVQGCKYLGMSDSGVSEDNNKQELTFKLQMQPNSHTITVEDVKINGTATTNAFEITTLEYNFESKNAQMDVRNGGASLSAPAEFAVTLTFPTEKIICTTDAPARINQDAKATCKASSNTAPGATPTATATNTNSKAVPTATSAAKPSATQTSVQAKAQQMGDQACKLLDFTPTTKDNKPGCNCGAVSHVFVSYYDFIEVDAVNVDGFKAICGSKS